jgi:hypothetical protein
LAHGAQQRYRFHGTCIDKLLGAELACEASLDRLDGVVVVVVGTQGALEPGGVVEISVGVGVGGSVRTLPGAAQRGEAPAEVLGIVDVLSNRQGVCRIGLGSGLGDRDQLAARDEHTNTMSEAAWG